MVHTCMCVVKGVGEAVHVGKCKISSRVSACIHIRIHTLHRRYQYICL